MTSHPVCPTCERCAKVAENGRFFSQESLEAQWGRACAAAIRADCQSSGCAARWAKGLELARDIRFQHRPVLSGSRETYECKKCDQEFQCDAIQLADHLEEKEWR